MKPEYQMLNAEIEKLSALLYNLLGLGYFEFQSDGETITGEGILISNEGTYYNQDQIAEILRITEADILKKIYKILHFYYPRWIAFDAIERSSDPYKPFSSNNQLLLALTSIIDWLANPGGERGGYTKRLETFLKKNLSPADIAMLIEDTFVKDANGNTIKLDSLEKVAEHIYEVRSLIVHKAELGGFYPYKTDFDPYNVSKTTKNIYTPKEFRRLLWKAIFRSLGLDIVHF